MGFRQEHIVLRSVEPEWEARVGGGPFGGPFRSSGPGAGPGVEVKVETLDVNDAPLLAQERNVVGVAPALPLRLVEPRETTLPTRGLDPTGKMAWGVAAVKAHTSRFTGKGISVAVLDTGIRGDHEAFAGMNLVCRNFTGEAEADLHGHGTHCAGTIFGRDVEGVRIGVARGVQRALVGKVLGRDGGSTAQLVDAIVWAVRGGAHVVSMSLGMDYPRYLRALVEQRRLPLDLGTSLALEGYRANVLLFERLAALLRAGPQPVVLVAAAGNESRREQDERVAIAVAPPAAAEGVISVAALRRDGAGALTVAGFSNRGARLAAPGVDILSACADGGLASMDGTSMAAPHAAGVAALWAECLQQDDQLLSEQLAYRLVGRASRQSPLAPGNHPADVGAGLALAPQAED